MPLCALPAQAASAAYELDPVHTRVMIAVEHAGFSKAIGTVSGSSGRLQFDPQDWTTASLEVSVPLARLDLGDEKWNQAVLARTLLDVEKFPTASFVSTRIEPIDARHASVYGTLNLHGVAREVKLEVTLNALKRHPLPPFRRTAGFSATATLSRADFGIDAWKSVIGDSVELRLEVEATRTRKDGDDEEQENVERHDTEQLPDPTIPTPEPATP
jgi:polyisoprenoid-binding protein YceI